MFTTNIDVQTVMDLCKMQFSLPVIVAVLIGTYVSYRITKFVFSLIFSTVKFVFNSIGYMITGYTVAGILMIGGASSVGFGMGECRFTPSYRSVEPRHIFEAVSKEGAKEIPEIVNVVHTEMDKKYKAEFVSYHNEESKYFLKPQFPPALIFGGATMFILGAATFLRTIRNDK